MAKMTLCPPRNGERAETEFCSKPTKLPNLNFRSPRGSLPWAGQSCSLVYAPSRLTVRGHEYSDARPPCASHVGSSSAYQRHGVSAGLGSRLLYKKNYKFLFTQRRTVSTLPSLESVWEPATESRKRHFVVGDSGTLLSLRWGHSSWFCLLPACVPEVLPAAGLGKEPGEKRSKAGGNPLHLLLPPWRVMIGGDLSKALEESCSRDTY